MARSHNSLLIVTFDENDNTTNYRGLTDPAVAGNGDPARRVAQNRIATVVAGARVRTGFAENTRFTHVRHFRARRALTGPAPPPAFAWLRRDPCGESA